MVNYEQPNQSSDELFDSLIKISPKMVELFVPSNFDEEKKAFLNGYKRNPMHDYPKLRSEDFSNYICDIIKVSKYLPDDVYASAYEAYIERLKKQIYFMQLAQNYNWAKSDYERRKIEPDFMQANIDLYGEPNESTYRSLMINKLAIIKDKPSVSDRAVDLKQELYSMLGGKFDNTQITMPYLPSKDTIDWLHSVALDLYEGMISIMPNQAKYNMHEIKDVFEQILVEQFGDSAKDWRVEIEFAKSINVVAEEKKIVVPADRKNVSRKELEKLIVHEIGVHVLRSISGEQTDLSLLRQGLSGYYEFEEGLAVVMEQALSHKYTERGVPYYLASGLAYFDNKDYRDTFEIMWRLNLLTGVSSDEEVDDLLVEKYRDKAYSQVFRIFRGTDRLPMFKDLAYYNGSTNIWKHLEKIKGDDIKFMFLLMGKADPTNPEHERLMYEAKSI